MPVKFQFYGTPNAVLSESYQQLRSVHPNVQAAEYTALSVRSGEAKPVTIETADDDLIVMQMSNDVQWHYRADEFSDFLNRHPGTKRGGTEGELEVPSFFVSQDDTRGLGDMFKTKALTVITGMAAKGAAKLLAEKMESSLDVGLHACNEKFAFTDFDVKNFVAGKPYLLFIHGTNSSTDGAFNGLKTNDAYNTLFKFYNGRVLAFEHKTLSESPVKNVTDLLNALPQGIVLDVVSHSRGGIVADLLARCSNGEVPFNADEMKIIGKNEDFQNLKDEATIANEAATGKNLVVTKMVRVACPAAGTVLIANRLDNVVNVLCNLLKLIPGAATCMPFTMFLDFAKAVVQERTDINVFPGLAAQIPGSPLVRMLNNPNRKIASELFVISGDVEHSGIFKSMLVIATNLYFGEAHDYVVNSNSMFRGTYRSIVVKEHFEQEASVNHFNYFINKKSQDALLTALVNTAATDKFYELIGETSAITIVHQRGETGKKPLVYILPGVMGSNLDVDAERVWLNYLGMVGGVLSKLNIGRANVTAESVHNNTYNNLINYLSSDFDVVPFPYDWRISLTEAADLLATDINKKLADSKRTCKEFYFIAHSMGGLVLRAMMHFNKDVWDKITAIKKPRVLMLGVPNEGSYGTVRILLGKDSVIKKLALLDFIHPKKYLLEIFKEYPALVQLLPYSSNGIFDINTWTNLQHANDEFTGVPSQSTLDTGLKFYNAIKDTNYDNDVFRYIAGQDDSTPENFSIVNGRIVFTATAQGDGRVLWNTIPASLLPANVYYVQADHGNIPKCESAFEGFKELLNKGTTSLLSNARPIARGTEQLQIMPDSDYVTIPSEGELNDALLSNKEKPRKTTSDQVINVSIINGDLVHSSYAVVVGHFTGDGIIYAERYLDKALDYKLSEYHLAGNYPGEIGTHLVILNDKTGVNETMICKGGVVVGLGDFGSLTENRLTASLTQAFLTLAIKYNESIRNKSVDADADFGISSLLIGSDFAGLRISNSVKAIFSAVMQANEKLEAMPAYNYKKINRVEIVEIYQHKAIQIGRIIKSFITEGGFSNFRFTPPVTKIGSGALKIFADENQQDNWHRLEVSVVKKESPVDDEDKRLLPIRFVSITDKAHADEEVLPANRLIVESLIQKVAKHSQLNKAFSQTLYELLIPNDLKGYGSSLRNLVLIVDEQTARYPWELLQDANGISEKPMVINTGIVRQLKTEAYRKNVIINNSSRALIIGNPKTEGKYPPLPAAEKEAENVLKIFQANGLEITSSIGEEDIDIVQKLLIKSYKIIHIASHGIVGATAKDPTGVVIGKEIVFTAGDFDQMRIVPEFVFINCCSSNEYDLAVAEQMRHKFDLAASVGTQLIEMGVKAAIVTGWEIDDSAAGAFSDTFYNAMFQGKQFGDAVRAAREKTYNEYGQTNTWGAYQCYGDPFYAFKPSGIKSKKKEYSFVDKIEVIYEIDNLISQITSASKRKGYEEYKPIIEDIQNALQPAWRQNAEIVERFAMLYKTLEWFDKAIECYQQLFSIEDAAYTIKSVEQYCNIRVRYGVKQFKNNAISKTEAHKLISNSIKELEKLNGTTFERYSLIAASYRRFFEIDNTDFKPLIKAAEYYRLAYEYSEKSTGSLYYYPYFNWLHFAILFSGAKHTEKFLQMPADRSQLDKQALAHAAELENTNPDFWNKTALSSHYLAELLSTKIPEEIAGYSKQIQKNFLTAWSKEGDPSARDSFITYIAFIISLLDQLAVDTKKIRDTKISALNNLIISIEKASDNNGKK